MKLTYIFHSGFAVETQSCVLVFDYWMDPADCMPVILSKGKPVYVLVSHFHEDHFSRDFFHGASATLIPLLPIYSPRISSDITDAKRTKLTS